MFIYLPLEGIPARGRNNIRVLLSIVSAAHGLVCHREIMPVNVHSHLLGVYCRSVIAVNDSHLLGLS